LVRRWPTSMRDVWPSPRSVEWSRYAERPEPPSASDWLMWRTVRPNPWLA
jgi:hypothetical protein